MNWSENEIKIILERYEIDGPTKLVEILNRSPRSIGRKAMDLGLKFNSSSFYESEEFNRVVSISKNIVDICRNLNLKTTGGNRNTIKKWIKIKNIDTSHFYIERIGKINCVSNIFEKNSTADRRKIKQILFNSGIKNRNCEMCGQGEFWMGKKMSLILDHINGINDDNRIENLRIVCPNCNATLETNGGRNIKNKLKMVH